MIAVGVLGSLGHEHDPVLDLRHPGIHSVAGALTAIADHSHLGESKYIKYFIQEVIPYFHNSPVILSHHQGASRVSLA